MPVDLRTCEQGDGAVALGKSIEGLLSGVDASREGILPVADTIDVHGEQWERFLQRDLARVKKAVFASYQATLALRLEDIELANQACVATLSLTEEQRRTARALTLEVLRSTRGARHDRPLERLAEAWQSESYFGHPAVSIAVKAAVFHEPLAAAQGAYFFQEWRASGAACLQSSSASLEIFLETQSTDLISLPASCIVDDPQSPFGQLKQHG